MDQSERRRFLIGYLLAERGEDANYPLPPDADGQKRLLRALMNVRPASPVSEDFLAVQNEYLRERAREKGVIDAASLPRIRPCVSLWQGDITRLKCGAIVNAANSQLLGCFAPCHGCIDNAIHTFAGVQLRLACARLKEREHLAEERSGGARITPAFNLPSRFVLHTVGPIVGDRVTAEDRAALSSCYRSCLELAAANDLESVAFCCISTGEYRFPNEEAAEIAVKTVTEFLRAAERPLHVIFNVFKDLDLAIYQKLLA